MTAQLSANSTLDVINRPRHDQSELSTRTNGSPPRMPRLSWEKITDRKREDFAVIAAR